MTGMVPIKGKLTEGEVGPQLIRMALPIAFGIISILFFNVVDTFWVSWLGEAELAAISFIFPLVFLFLGVSVGLSTGTTSVVSKAIGQGDHHRVQELTLHAILLAGIVVTGLCVAGGLLMDSWFHLLGADPVLMPLIREYFSVWFYGFPILVVSMAGNACVRATGDARTPGIVMLVSALVNAGLDPLLIFGWGPVPAFGMAGAAYATVISWLLGSGIVFAVLIFREKLLILERPHLYSMLRSWRSFLYIGLPAAGTHMLNPLVAATMTALIAGFGSDAVAGYGVGCRIEAVALVAVVALSLVLNPFIGQNWGAGMRERIDQALKLCFRFSLVFGLVIWPSLVLLTPFFAALFTADPETIEVLRWFFCIFPIGYGAQGLFMISCATFNALHLPLRATALSGIRILVFYLPLAYVGGLWYGVVGVFVGGCIANILSGLLGYLWVRQTTQELETAEV